VPQCPIAGDAYGCNGTGLHFSHIPRGYVGSPLSSIIIRHRSLPASNQPVSQILPDGPTYHRPYIFSGCFFSLKIIVTMTSEMLFDICCDQVHYSCLLFSLSLQNYVHYAVLEVRKK